MSVTRETTHMRIPIELKSELESLQNRFYTKKNYEIVECLVKSLRAFDEYKQQVRQERIEAKEKEERELLNVGQKVKSELELVKEELNVKEDADIVMILLLHYRHSDNINKMTLQYLLSVK